MLHYKLQWHRDQLKWSVTLSPTSPAAESPVASSPKHSNWGENETSSQPQSTKLNPSGCLSLTCVVIIPSWATLGSDFQPLCRAPGEGECWVRITYGPMLTSDYLGLRRVPWVLTAISFLWENSLVALVFSSLATFRGSTYPPLWSLPTLPNF